jgi:hypothetical protein
MIENNDTNLGIYSNHLRSISRNLNNPAVPHIKKIIQN